MTPNVSTPKLPEATFIATSVSLRGLQRVGARLSLLDYLVSLWDYRHFMYYDARARVKSENLNDRLGSAWLILAPLLNGLVYYLIMGVILKSGAGVPNFVAFLLIGVFLFQFSIRSITSSAKSISANKNVIHAFSFPRATLVTAINIRELLANVPVLITMLVLIIALPPVETISWRWLLLIPIVALQFVFNIGVGLFLARIVFHFNDMNYIIGYATRAWMYASCMFFSIDRFSKFPVAVRLMEHNPLYQVLFMAREVLLYGRVPSWNSWIILALWALASLAVGMIFFWRAEESYGREI